MTQLSRWQRVFASATVGVLLGMAVVQGASLVVVNPSFEQPAYSPGQFGVGIPGWTITPNAQAGIQNTPAAFSVPMPDGQQAGFLNLTGSVSQVLPDAVEGGMTYTLRVDLGQALHMQAPSQYAVQLRAGGQILASTSPDTIKGQFVAGTATCSIPAGDSRIGAPLEIMIVKSNSIYGTQVVFDHVRLEATRDGPPLVINPPGGEFTNSLQVTLSTYLAGTDIRYTLDGSEPVMGSAVYQQPLTLTQSGTVRTRLFVGSAPASDIVSASFTRVPDLTFTPAPGVFTNVVEVALQNHLGLGEPRYTLDGTDPTEASPVYGGPIRLTAAATLKASVWLNGFPISIIHTGSYLRYYAVDDGIPNAWREQYFGPGYATDPRVGALEDPDRDGANNLQEYAAGTHPLDPLSGFAVGIEAVPMVNWPSVPGQSYRILRKLSLADPDWVVVEAAYRATETRSTYVDVSVAGQRAFYTVQPAAP